MNGAVPRVLPWQPVGELLGKRNRGAQCRDARRRVYDAVWVGRVLGSSTECGAHRKGERVKRDGLTVWEADRLAVALGWLPWTIWGDAWWLAPGSAREDRADGWFRLLGVSYREAS